VQTGVEKLEENKLNIQVIKPKLKHAQQIKDLLDYYSRQQIVLPRSIVDISEKIRIFWIAVDTVTNEVVGCAGVQFYWDYRAEIKSLAVKKEYWGHGIGNTLVKKCIEEAKEFGVKKIFALTYITDFFKKMGFEGISKNSLPQKIWTECINCQHFPNCNEDAVELILQDNQEDNTRWI